VLAREMQLDLATFDVPQTAAAHREEVRLVAL